MFSHFPGFPVNVGTMILAGLRHPPIWKIWFAAKKMDSEIHWWKNGYPMQIHGSIKIATYWICTILGNIKYKIIF